MLRLLAIIMCILAAHPAPGAQEAAPARADLESQLDAAVLRAGLGQFWGAVLVAREGEVLLVRGYGYATEELDPITRRSLFDIGSIAKMFTAAAILRLQEQGKLSTSDTIARFFPEAGDAAGQITIHHLLTHTSGKSDTRGAIQQLTFEDRDEAVRRFAASSSSAAPGERFEYCNGGYVVLGAIIEAASGMRYEDCVRQLVLKPAGMTSSGFLDGAGIDPGHQTIRVTGAGGARGRRGLLLDKRIEPWAWGLRGAGGLVTCLDDLLAFDAAIREERLLSPAAAQAWTTPEQANYACGWRVQQDSEGRLRHSHGGATRGYMCELRRYPEEGVVIAVLSNESGRAICFPGWIADELANTLWPPPKLETVATLDLSREKLGQYSEVVLEEGVTLDAAADGDGVMLMATHAEPQRELFRARLNRAAAKRLRDQIDRMLTDPQRTPAPGGGLKLGMFAYLYRAQLGEQRTLRIDGGEWSIMPSYSGIDAEGRQISDPRLVITLMDPNVPGAWPLMIHADDGRAREIVRELDAALAGDGQ